MQPNKMPLNYNIAIVGLGPKGLYAFAELAKHLLAENINGINIFLIDKSGYFGTGPIYQTIQPNYLLMNYENGHIDHSPLYISKEKRKTYNQFAKPKLKFSARRDVGNYLLDLYNDLKSKSQDLINIREVRASVENIKKIGSRFYLETVNNQVQGVAFDQVMITSGHNTCIPCNDKIDFKVNFIYPPENKLRRISESNVVIVKGLGLTFIDAVLGLTEGKGGQFIAGGKKLKYLQSGKEPRKIIPFSRTGELMLPRESTLIPSNFKLMSKSLEQISKVSNHQLDFEEDIIPALEDEFSLQGGNGTFVEAIDLNNLSLLQLIDISEGKSNRDKLLASKIWRKFAISFNKIYSHRGLSPTSHRRFDEYWKGKLQRISYGPPLINYKKIQAIYEAGLLDFNFSKSPSIDFEEKILTDQDGQSSASFTYFVDARIPANNIFNNPSELYRNMLNAGLIRPAGNGDYVMGCIDLDSDGHSVGKDGEVISQLTFYGIPTEGITYNNDTLSTNHNNYAINWIKEIQKDIESEYNNINSDPSQLGSKLKVSA